MELYSSSIKIFLIFSDNSGNGNPKQISTYFRKLKTPNRFFCISGNRNPKELLIFQEVELFFSKKPF